MNWALFLLVMVIVVSISIGCGALEWIDRWLRGRRQPPRDIELRRPNPLPRDVESDTAKIRKAPRVGMVSNREAAEGVRMTFRGQPLPNWLEVTESQRKRMKDAVSSNVEIGFYGPQFEELRRKIMASEITDAQAVDRLAVSHADRCLKDPGGWHPLPMAVLQGILREKGE